MKIFHKQMQTQVLAVEPDNRTCGVDRMLSSKLPNAYRKMKGKSSNNLLGVNRKKM